MAIEETRKNLTEANKKADENLRKRAATFNIKKPCGTRSGTARRVKGDKLLVKNEPEPGWPGGRSHFEIDRDLVLLSSEFVRLARKTQVFTGGKGAAYRNRLTHTLDVAQLSRSVAHKSGLSVDLAEAIAYGHDVGHTPFGHAGEKALNLCLYEYFVRRSIDEKGLPDIAGLAGKRSENGRRLDQAIWYLVEWLSPLNPENTLPASNEVQGLLKPSLFKKLLDNNILKVIDDNCAFNETLDWFNMPEGQHSVEREFMVQRGKRELFAHYTHSLRVLLCNSLPERRDIDLTRETAYGILSHSWTGPYDKFELYGSFIPSGKICLTEKDDNTPEAFLVRMADDISFVNSDLNDANKAGIVLWKSFDANQQDAVRGLANVTGQIESLPPTSQRLQYCETGFRFLYGKKPEYNLQDVISKVNKVVIEKDVHPVLIPRQESAKRIIRELFWFLCRSGISKRSVELKAMGQFNKFNQDRWGTTLEPTTPRLVADYIAWLTDDEAITIHSALFAPEHSYWERHFYDVQDF